MRIFRESFHFNLIYAYKMWKYLLLVNNIRIVSNQLRRYIFRTRRRSYLLIDQMLKLSITHIGSISFPININNSLIKTVKTHIKINDRFFSKNPYIDLFQFFKCS